MVRRSPDQIELALTYGKAPLRAENNFKGHKIDKTAKKLRQYISLLKSPNFDAAYSSIHSWKSLVRSYKCMCIY